MEAMRAIIRTDVVNKVLETNGGIPTPALIESLLLEYRPELKRLEELYDRFLAEDLPIEGKVVQNKNWSNYKLKTNLEGHIIRLYTGFMNPYATSYSFPSTPENKDVNDRLSRWARMNTIEAKDAETLQLSAACGLSYICVDQADQRLYNLKPFEMIPIYQVNPERLDYALRFYQVYMYETDTSGKLTRKLIQKFEWYSPDWIIYYERQGEKDQQAITELKRIPNLLKVCPIVMVRFNSEMKSNYENVKEMCDAYRDVLSTFVDEGVNIKWAILKFLGLAQPDSIQKDSNGETEQDRFVRMLKDAFSLFIPPTGQTGSVNIEWLSKQLPKDIIEFLLDKLHEQILIQSETFDPDSPNVGKVVSNISGVGMDYKLLSMTSKCLLAKTYFLSGMREVMRIVISAWNIIMNSKYDPYDIDIVMNFNKPVDRLTEIQILAQGKGILSQKTLLSNSLIVKDVNAEILQLKAEQTDSINFYTDLDKQSVKLDNQMSEEELKTIAGKQAPENSSLGSNEPEIM